ncbi:MAG: undecaprenyl-diphosphate phosphatase [Bdellovibrionales bacterium]
MNFAQAMILAVVEGLTEYLPVSSTGHIILTSWVMGINQDEFVKDYTVMVQFGAILAVLVLFSRRFLLNFKIYPTIFIAFLPAAIIGLAVKKHIDAILGNVWIVAIALLVGGIFLVLTDHWLKKHKVRVAHIDATSRLAALKIGFFQCLAFIPGMSRSAATIWGGLFEGLSLVAATEFSFFLAVPTLSGATFLKVIKVYPSITADQWKILLVGNIVSFVVGLAAIRFFVHLITRFGIKYFGYYRIVLGAVVLVVLAMGHEIEFL